MLLFGEEKWVVTPRMRRVLVFFQYQVVRQLMRRLPRRRSDESWDYTLSEAAIEEARFESMETYIRRRQNTSAQYIATIPILDLCEASERKLGKRVGMQW